MFELPCGGEGLAASAGWSSPAAAAAPTAAERDCFSRRGTARRLPAGLPGDGRRADERRWCPQPRWSAAPSSDPGPTAAKRPRPAATAIRSICKRYVELPPPDARRRCAPTCCRLERAARAARGRSGAAPRAARPTARRPISAARRCWPTAGSWTSSRATPKRMPTRVAVDVGTTTLVGRPAGPGHRPRVAVASRLNPQTRFGDDVLSRILLARTRPDGLAAAAAGGRRGASTR